MKMWLVYMNGAAHTLLDLDEQPMPEIGGDGSIGDSPRGYWWCFFSVSKQAAFRIMGDLLGANI